MRRPKTTERNALSRYAGQVKNVRRNSGSTPQSVPELWLRHRSPQSRFQHRPADNELRRRVFLGGETHTPLQGISATTRIMNRAFPIPLLPRRVASGCLAYLYRFSIGPRFFVPGVPRNPYSAEFLPVSLYAEVSFNMHDWVDIRGQKSRRPEGTNTSGIMNLLGGWYERIRNKE